MEEWPITIPQSPLLDGFKDVPQNSVLRSDFAGYTKQRNRFTAALHSVTERYFMSASEYADFKTWYSSTLGNGSLDFLKTDPETGLTQTYRFTDVYDADRVGLDYIVTVELEKLP